MDSTVHPLPETTPAGVPPDNSILPEPETQEIHPSSLEDLGTQEPATDRLQNAEEPVTSSKDPSVNPLVPGISPKHGVGGGATGQILDFHSSTTASVTELIDLSAPSQNTTHGTQGSEAIVNEQNVSVHPVKISDNPVLQAQSDAQPPALPATQSSAQSSGDILVPEDGLAELSQIPPHISEQSTRVPRGENRERSTGSERDSRPQAGEPARAIQKNKQTGKKRKPASSGNGEKDSDEAKTKRRKNVEERKRKKEQALERVGNQADAVVEKRSKRRKCEGGRKRQATPDGAENQRIAPTEVRMADLCAETNQGKISSREVRLRERDKVEEEKKKLATQEEARKQASEFMNHPTGTAQSIQTNSENGGGASAQPSGEASGHPEDDMPAQSGPRTQIVDGQIVFVENSHIIDRHNREGNIGIAFDENASVVIEDDLTKRVNSASYLKRAQPHRWSAETTQLFYEGLRYFGMDFSMMVALFPGKSRNSLKMKFIREQRADVNFINQVLKERKPVPSIEELQKTSGKVFRRPQEIYKELAQNKEKQLEDRRKEDEAVEEARRGREREVEEEAGRLGVRIAPTESVEVEGDGEGEHDGNIDRRKSTKEQAKKPAKKSTRISTKNTPQEGPRVNKNSTTLESQVHGLAAPAKDNPKGRDDDNNDDGSSHPSDYFSDNDISSGGNASEAGQNEEEEWNGDEVE